MSFFSVIWLIFNIYYFLCFFVKIIWFIEILFVYLIYTSGIEHYFPVYSEKYDQNTIPTKIISK